MYAKQVLLGGRGEGQGSGGQAGDGSASRPVLLSSQPPHSRDRWGWSEARRTGDWPAHLDVDEDDLNVLRFEEPLQGLHEVLWEGREG